MVMIASLGGTRTQALRVTAFWALAFAVLTGIAVVLTHNYFRNRTHWPRLASLLFSLLVAAACYFFALAITGGYILNAQYPLFIVFLCGSVPAFVDAAWPSRSIAAACSLFVIVALSFSVTALFWITKRHHRTRVTVVKLIPQANSNGLQISWQPEIEPDEFEREQLQKLGLNGEAQVTNVYDLGPHQGSVAHTLVIMTHPLGREVRLSEGRSDLIYLQRDQSWQKFPPDASVSWRNVKMYQASSNCTVVLVWYRLDHQSGSGGPRFNTLNPQ